MAAIRVRTSVLRGGKVEFTVPDLQEGESVEVVVHRNGTSADKLRDGEAFMKWLRSRPSRRTPEEWEQFERDFQAERDSWDR